MNEQEISSNEREIIELTKVWKNKGKPRENNNKWLGWKPKE